MAAQRRKKASRRRGASRAGSRGAPALGWFLAGLLVGLGISAMLFLSGRLPGKSGTTPAAPDNRAGVSEPALIGGPEEIAGAEEKSRFDFFTVLPEMEVVVPEQELSDSAQPGAGLPVSDGGEAYILQVGSFRNAADAEQMKARLALLGAQARVQVVTVNDATWHRVRIGPVPGARKADEMRRMLQDHGIETLVMKGSS